MGGGGGINLGGGAIGSAIGGAVLGPVGAIAGGLKGGVPQLFGPQGGGPGAPGIYMPMPDRPDWGSNLDPATGLLKSGMTTQWGNDVTSDQRGLNASRDIALSDPSKQSAWAGQALNKQALEEQGMRENAISQGAGAAASARSSLASKYGLGAGANTSLAKQQMRDQAMALQGVGQQGAKARADIGLQDYSQNMNNRNQFLSALPGQDLAQSNLAMQNKTGNLANQQYNIGNAINETNAKRAADLSAYSKQMEMFGANKNANAMQSQSSGGKK